MGLRRTRALRTALALGLVSVACQEENRPILRAIEATSRDQLIGGVAAVADVGDIILENDAARFVILGGHGSPGPGIFGGTLVDADLQRTEREFRAGRGLDHFSELFPFANLAVPNPTSAQVTIAEDGGDGTEAIVRVRAKSDQYLDALSLLDRLALNADFEMVTEYRLKPKQRLLRIKTRVNFDQTTTPPVQPLDGISTPPSIFSIILSLPPQFQATGAVTGDFLFFGNKTDVFTPGYGFDLDLKLREIFNGGCDSVNVPVGVDWLAAEGDRVSYAYASDAKDGGRVYVPLFASSFTAVMTHKKECNSAAECLGEASWEYERLFGVGDGDVASALAPIYEAKGIATGLLQGRVVDGRDGSPVSGARVFLLADPGAADLPDARLASDDPDTVIRSAYALNRRRTAVACSKVPPDECERCDATVDPFGEPGVVTSLRTDRGTDNVLDGDFSGRVPPGDYLVFSRSRHRPTSSPRRLRIVAGETSEALLVLPPSATAVFRVEDEAGRPMPAKLTVGRCLPECVFDADCPQNERCDSAEKRCFPRGGCGAGGCRSYESCNGDDCRCDASTALDVTLGDPLNPDHIDGTAFADADGTGRLTIRPGEWEVLVSRGPEYDVARLDVTFDPLRPAEHRVALHRVVDTQGWISGDFHVHGIFSHDSNVTHDMRVRSMMGEGVELVSSADHDALVDFTPAIRRLGGQSFLKGQVGLETTTVEMGHFIGHPLVFDELAPFRNGAIDWNGMAPGASAFCDVDDDRVVNPAVDRVVPRGTLVADCDGHEVLDDGGIIGRLRSLGLFGERETVVTVPHPRDGFFGYFDQFSLDAYDLRLYPNRNLLELLNPILKPPFFETDFDAIELYNGKRFDFIRTPTIAEVAGFTEELEALRFRGLPNDELEARVGELGDRWVRTILRREPAEQAAIMASDGRIECSPRPCDFDDVLRVWECGFPEKCEMATRTCYRECDSARPCPAELGTCDGASGRCVRPPDAPCTEHRGVMDDWFRLLNTGVSFVGLANSDTHGLMSVESGLPRNWIRSSSDEPQAIDILEIARNTLKKQVIGSYGPFVQLDVNGAGVGDTLTRPDGPVVVHVTVQSPLWFDVDRLELYRNGQLWRTVDAGTPHPDCATVDGLPNKQVLNFECAFTDEATSDAWFVAVAMGLRGKDMRPVYTSLPVLYLEIGDITGRAFSNLRALGVGAKAEVPRQYPVLPLGYTNPVWVDRAGDGFDPPVAIAEDSPFRGRVGGAQPLSSRAIGSSPLPAPEPIDASTPAQAARALQDRFRRAFDAHHHGARTDRP